jgi:hypothetical protein
MPRDLIPTLDIEEAVLEIIKAVIVWNDDPSQAEHAVSFGIIPDGWANKLDKHPKDDEMFFWLHPDEELFVGFNNGEWTVVTV